MSITWILPVSLVLIVVLIRRKIPIGLSILAGGFLMWATLGGTFLNLWEAVLATVEKPRTYDLLFALYFVMCLEIQLRSSGTLQGMVAALNRIFHSTKVTIASMPAFLGLLPSMGGARFSAPIVEQACKGHEVPAESKAAINFWFRHIFEFCNPIIPGMLLACGIVGIHISDLAVHLFWLTVFAYAAGWFILVRPLKIHEPERTPMSSEDRRKYALDITLAFLPIFANIFLMIAFGLPAAVSMGIVVAGMVPVLMIFHRKVDVGEIVKGAFDWRLLLNIVAIFYFIEILTASGIIDQITAMFRAMPFPVPVILTMTSFVIGILTGLSQGHVAMVMPIVAALAPGDLVLTGAVLVFGVAGQMITPTHVCLTITVDYFKSDFLKTLIPIVILEVILLTVFTAWTLVSTGYFG